MTLQFYEQKLKQMSNVYTAVLAADGADLLAAYTTFKQVAVEFTFICEQLSKEIDQVINTHSHNIPAYISLSTDYDTMLDLINQIA